MRKTIVPLMVVIALVTSAMPALGAGSYNAYGFIGLNGNGTDFVDAAYSYEGTITFWEVSDLIDDADTFQGCGYAGASMGASCIGAGLVMDNPPDDLWFGDIGSNWGWTDTVTEFAVAYEQWASNSVDGLNYTGVAKAVMDSGLNPPPSTPTLTALPSDLSTGARYNGGQDVDLTFTSMGAAADPDSLILGYNVYMAIDNDNNWVPDAAWVPATLNGPEPAHAYGASLTYGLTTLTPADDYIFYVVPRWQGIHYNVVGTRWVEPQNVMSTYGLSEGGLPEFGTLIVPVVGMGLMSIVLIALRRREED